MWHFVLIAYKMKEDAFGALLCVGLEWGLIPCKVIALHKAIHKRINYKSSLDVMYNYKRFLLF